jgi:hypothetical protein
MNLISLEKRTIELRKFSIPERFLENIGNIEQLKFRLKNPDSAYFYFPKIANYQILKDLNVIPIYNCGETFYVLTYNQDLKRIIKFELERDEIYKNYGLNWNLLLLDIMIDYFDSEIEDELSLKEFQSVGEKLGFMQSKELYTLRNLSIEEYNAKFSDDKNWRLEIAKKINVL